MQTKLLEVLACPRCGGALECTATETVGGEVAAGRLDCVTRQHQFPIEDGIPRFVPRENYAQSFGYQWNKFKLEQIDSVNGTRLSANRFYAETGWTKEWLAGKWILDAGCGAGRFLDVATDSEAEVVGLDLSSAIDAARANLAVGQMFTLYKQASMSRPFVPVSLMAAIALASYSTLLIRSARCNHCHACLRPGGQIAITAYERKSFTKLYAKYLVRPFTKRLNKQKLLAAIKGSMPVLFPLTDVLFRIPLAGRLFMFAIPVANYVHERTLSRSQRYDWAILDTFDMLSPQYDQPRTQQEVEQALASAGVPETVRLPGPGLTIVGTKRKTNPSE